jgi:hypothetical protein
MQYATVIVGHTITVPGVLPGKLTLSDYLALGQVPADLPGVATVDSRV